jgi:hypothetical protein
MLPYQKAITNKISRLLAKYNIKTVHIPQKKNIHMFRLVKDELGLKVPGLYQIPCECGKAYVGQTGRSMLDKATGCMDRLMKEAIEIRLNTGNFNRGFMLSRAWYPVMNMLSYQKAGRNGEHYSTHQSPLASAQP